MKQSIKIAMASVLMAVFGWMACGTVHAAEGSKFAFVDIAKVVDEYQKTKENDAVLQSLGRQKEDQREALVQEIKQMKDEQALLSEDARAKKQEAIEDKVRSLQEFDQTVQRDLNEQRNKILKEIFQDIDDTVNKYSEKKGLEFSVNERVLVYRAAK